ncbi:MAG TPA: hypothetical protein VNX88_03925 [Terriglobales bacterium]|jgi:hypothetical protein|nr:hypothetical protein [Terriglobales bacterium]
MDARIVLFFMTEFAGLVMVAGGIWLIYKQKIYVDKESQQPLEVGLPGGFTFKSNYPALALFALGFFPLIYPFAELSKLTEYPHVVTVKLTGVPNTNVYPALVYASVAPYAVTREGDSFSVPVPFIGTGDQEYKVLLIANEHVLDSQTAKKSGKGEVEIKFRPTILEPSEYKTTDTPTPPSYK